jgi:hypothetical protein
MINRDASILDINSIHMFMCDEYVGIEGARTLYGVVIKGDPIHDPEGLEIDFEATRQLREEMVRR